MSISLDHEHCMQVFINPAVARLPAHTHLLAEGGSFVNYDVPKRHCEDTPGESKIPMEYRPLTITNDMELEWKKIVTKRLEEGNVLILIWFCLEIVVD